MNKRTAHCLLPVLAAGLLAGCSDPSKSVPKSAASDPAAKPDSTAPASSSKAYTIRSESTVGFIGSKVTGSHNGGFKNFAGTISVDAGKISGTPEIKIGMKSIWTDTDRLTGHLRSPDFFDVEKFPVSTFSITAIEGTGPTNKITGNLEMHGVTKAISFPATVQVADDAVTVKAVFAINRKQWNINYPGKPNDLIRDNVVVKLDLKATPGAVRPEDQLAN